MPLAVTVSTDMFYLGWICPRCLADDNDGFLDVLGVYATRGDAEWGLHTDEVTLLHHRDWLLLIQAVASLLPDGLGGALLAASATAPPASAFVPPWRGCRSVRWPTRPGEWSAAGREPAQRCPGRGLEWPRGAHWLAHRHHRDRMLAPFADLLMAAVQICPGETVLDVGCGCGSTTLAAARAAGPGRAIGIDLSAPMLAEARQRAASERGANVIFVGADAQVMRIDPPIDVVISRFGVMFFDDPPAAFANLAGGCAPTGRQ